MLKTGIPSAGLDDSAKGFSGGHIASAGLVNQKKELQFCNFAPGSDFIECGYCLFFFRARWSCSKKAMENSRPEDIQIKDAEQIGVSSQNLEELITVLQDEQKRTEFLNKLQALQAVSEDQQSGKQEVTIAKGFFQKIGSWFADKYALTLEMFNSPEGIKILIVRSVLSLILLVLAIWGLKFLNRRVFDAKKLHFALKYAGNTVLAAVVLSILLLIWDVNLFGIIGLSVWKQLILSGLFIGML